MRLTRRRSFSLPVLLHLGIRVPGGELGPEGVSQVPFWPGPAGPG